MEIYTIGFTKRSAAGFFGALKDHGIRRLIDIRRHNTSQLAAYAKRDDLQYFLREICGAEYIHEPLLAPSEELLAAYRGKKTPWAEYEAEFLRQMDEREIARAIDRALFQVPTVLLCSEPTAQRCHRRLVVEYLNMKWEGVTPVHL